MIMLMDLIIPLAIVLGVLILFLIGFMLLKTALFTSKQKPVEQRAFVEIDGHSVAERLGLALQFKSVSSHNPEEVDGEAFLGLHRLLRTLYPRVHSALKLETINDYSLLFTWEGQNPDLEAVMLIAHLDVVPADEGEDSKWTHSPFGGEVAEGYVWGRGAIDDKGSVIGILEAVEYLLAQGFQPERTVYIGFDHDEEVSGLKGAKAIVEMLQSRGVRLACLLDEGGLVSEGLVPGIKSPIGVIGISEKGYLSLRLTVDVVGGHSAMPPRETAIGIISRAIAKLELNPMPAHLEVVEFLMSYIGSGLPFHQRMLFANTWLFGGKLKKRLSKSKNLNAMIRTTTAPTIIKGGVKDNVLPDKAEAVVNFRIFPGDDLRSVYEMVRERINDERVDVAPLEGDVLAGDTGWDPTPVADTESPYFESLADLVKMAFPGAMVAPYLLTGATNARHYAPLTDNAFRFCPVMVSQDELQRMHGVDERLSVENCGRMVGFYVAYIEEMTSLPGEA
jgi:carboxypeptidase PM20D1